VLTILAVSAYDAGRYAAYAVLALLLVALVRRIRSGRRSPRSRLTDSIAACVVALLLGTGVVRAATDGDPWSSEEGVEMRAGFLAGCESSAGTAVDCGCTFDALVSAPAYDTPKEFAALGAVVERAIRENDVSVIPAEYLNAARSCARA
jgi:hypothetical protein